MKELLLCILNALLMAVGQLLFKFGAKGKSMGTLSEIFHVVINPVVILALFIYGISTVIMVIYPKQGAAKLCATHISFGYSNSGSFIDVCF